MSDPKTRADKAREHADFHGFNADDLFQPNLAAEIDDTRSWVDPNGYRLSDRLWLGKDADRNAIDTVLREGLAAGDSVAGTAGRLREFLNPDTAGGNYAARRLARTETTRAFGAATLAATKANPFSKGVKWSLSGSHTEPDECNDNANRSSNDMPRGEYRIEDVPRYPAHPNCLCNLQPVMLSDDEFMQALAAQPPVEDDTVSKLFDELFGPAKAAPPPVPTGRVDIAAFNTSEAGVLQAALDAGGYVDKGYEQAPEWTYGGMQGNRYTPEEASALREYKASHYGPLNKYLRADQDYAASRVTLSPAKLAELRDNIDSAFAKAEPLKEPIRVSRGSFTDFVGVADQVPGNMFTDRGYSSTSAKVGGVGFGRELQLDIYVPEGVKVLPMDALTAEMHGEVEVLLPRGTTFLIREVHADQNRLVVEVLP